MKISEISKELGIESKEIIAFVNQKGIECKAATKNLSDEETDMVKKAFSKKEEKKEEVKKETPKEDKPKTAAPKDAQSAKQPTQPAQNAQAQANNEKKASKFNFKINPQFVSNNQSQGQKRPNQGQGQNRPQNNNFLKQQVNLTVQTIT